MKTGSTAMTFERAVLFGAGLSRPSGLPVVTDFVNALLAVIDFPSDAKKDFAMASIPFELFVQTLAERSNIVPLLEIYAKGSPNYYHYFLAEMAKRNEIGTIVTTNFDTLLEEALASQDLYPKKDYLLYDDPAKFGRIQWQSSKLIVVKIHGTISKPDMLGATLDRVASRQFLTSARKVLSPLLSGRRCKEFYVAGYSFSDVFDITPAIESLKDRKVDIIQVAYRSGRGCETGETNPKGMSSSVREISVRTDVFVRMLSSRYGLSLAAKPSPRKNRAIGGEFREQIKLWEGSIARDDRGLYGTYTTARLLYRIGRFDLALSAVGRLISLAKGKWEADANLNRGIFHYRLGQYKQAVVSAIDAARVGAREDLPLVVSQALGNMGNALHALGRNHWALKWQMVAAREAKDLNNLGFLANTYGNIGIIFDDLERYASAVLFHRRALRLARRIGDAIGVARHLCNIALTLNKLGNFPAAESAAQSALEMASLTGQSSLEAAAWAELARARRRLNPVLAKADIERAISLAATSNPGYEPRYEEICGEICMDMGLSKEATMHFRRSDLLLTNVFGRNSKRVEEFRKRMEGRWHAVAGSVRT